MRPVLLFYAPDTGPALSGYIRQLEEDGYEVVSCRDIQDLRQRLEGGGSHSGQVPLITVLAAGQVPNHAAAGVLAAAPHIGVLMLLDDTEDVTLAAALRLGVEAWCPDGCAPLVLALAVHNLRRRLEWQRLESTTRAESASWLLYEQAWRLRAPQGADIRLTGSERAFMLALAALAGQVGSHIQLSPAETQTLVSEEILKTRLGVLVSRLKQKAARHGAELPIKSLHGRGYMFAGLICVLDEADSGG